VTGPSLVLFDVDGTLVDGTAQVVAAFAAMAGGRSARDRSECRSIVGRPPRFAIARFEPDLDMDDIQNRADACRGALLPIEAGLVEVGAEFADDTVIDIGRGRAAGVANGRVAGHQPSGFLAETGPGAVIKDFGALGTAIREVSEVFA